MMAVFAGPLTTSTSQTVSSAAAALSADGGNGVQARGAVVEVQAAAIRYRVSGTDPTASAGHIANPGDVISLTSQDEVSRFRAIRSTGSDATIEFTLYASVGG